MRNILHLCAANYFGGPEKQIVGHFKQIDRARFNPVVVSLHPKKNNCPISQQARDVGIQTHSVSMSSPFDLMSLYRLIKLVKKKRIDLICSHGYKPTVMGWITARKTGVPIIAFSRGYTSENKKVRFYEYLENLVLKRVDGIITVSAAQKQKLESLGIRNTEKWVVHNAVSINGDEQNNDNGFRDAFLKTNHLPDNCTLAITAGRLSPEKGHRFLIDAIGLLDAKTEDTYFVFCGDGVNAKSLKEQMHSTGVAEKCRFIGFQKDIMRIFRIMDFLVLPSLTEGLPNVVLEAFACKKPVLGTWVGGVPEVVEHKINGILVRPGCPDALVQGINLISECKELSIKMGENGYDRVKKQFSFGRQNKQLQAIYERYLCNGGQMIETS